MTHVRVDNANVVTHIGFGGQAITKASAVQWIELGLFNFYTNVNGVVEIGRASCRERVF